MTTMMYHPADETDETDVVDILAARLSEDRGYSPGNSVERARRYIEIIRGIQGDGRSGTFFAGVDVTHGREVIDEGKMAYWINTNFLYVGRPTIIWAPTGVGKTHLASFVATRALDLNKHWDILSNIPWYWIDDESLTMLRPPNLKTISTMSELLKEACESVICGRIPAAIIDEMDNAIVSQNWRSPENRSWKSLGYIERHLELRGPLIIYHSWNDIPFYMRRAGNVNDFLPPDLHGGQRHVYSGRTRPHNLIIDEDIIPYSSHGEIGFNIDVDMEALRKRLRTSRRIEYARQVLENLDRCMIRYADENEEPQATGDSVLTEAVSLHESGMSVREIAKRTGVPTSTIQYKLSKWYSAHGGG